MSIMDIQIPEPSWNSPLTSLILDLEKMRTQILYSEVPPYIFFQLKQIFQIMETLGSARIEGNNTTLSEYVEKIIEKNTEINESQQELENLDQAISFIESNTNENTKIDRAYLSQLHRIVTNKLTPPPKGEGSCYPGELRKKDVKITKSSHKPVSIELLQEAFERFVDFINQTLPEQNQLLMVAISHHAFMHIHPFDNGNGRMGRLLSYALLINSGFNVKAGRIINPSSVFYTDRDQYYKMLGQADSLKEKDLLAWSEYFLSGLKNQIEKINTLRQLEYTRNEILLPALKIALDRQHITDQEYDILCYLVKSKKMCIKATELDKLGISGSQKKTYLMSKLKENKMIRPLKENGRIYTIVFANSYLLRGVIKVLESKGFIADFLNNNTKK